MSNALLRAFTANFHILYVFLFLFFFSVLYPAKQLWSKSNIAKLWRSNSTKNPELRRSEWRWKITRNQRRISQWFRAFSSLSPRLYCYRESSKMTGYLRGTRRRTSDVRRKERGEKADDARCSRVRSRRTSDRRCVGIHMYIETGYTETVWLVDHVSGGPNGCHGPDE